MPGGNASAVYLGEECSVGSLPINLPHWNPQRDSDGSRHRIYVQFLGITSIRTSVYHPQTDGLVKWFNKTLKSMLRKFVHEDSRRWDKWLEPLLFAVREVPQASTGFSLFELLFGRRPRGVLDLIRENWEEGTRVSKSDAQYIMDLRAKLHSLGQMSQENVLKAQEHQQHLYNRGT